MKRLLALILVWTLLVITGTLVSADGQTRRKISKLELMQQCSINESRQIVLNKRRLSDGIR